MIILKLSTCFKLSLGCTFYLGAKFNWFVWKRCLYHLRYCICFLYYLQVCQKSTIPVETEVQWYDFRCAILAYVSEGISTYWSVFWHISFFLLVICCSIPFLLDDKVTKVRPSMTLWLDPVLAKSNSGCYKALVDFIGEFVEFGICTSREKLQSSIWLLQLNSFWTSLTLCNKMARQMTV